MIRLRYILFLFYFSLLLQPIKAAAKDPSTGIDVQHLILGHIKDAYHWHITTINDRHISIPLPIIIYTEETGWQCFSSSIFDNQTEHLGYHIAQSGLYEGKLVKNNEKSELQRPLLDLSITKTVLAIYINSLILILTILYIASWYRKQKKDTPSPRGFRGAMEMLITSLIDDVIKPNIGKKYARYVPYLLTIFFFIFFNNIMGIIPLFPGGSNVTGNIAVTMTLSICTFFVVNVFGNKEYWKEVLWPDVPLLLKAPIPLMPFIEIFGMFVKPFALTMRLFANILAGHMVILAFVSIIFISASISAMLGLFMTPVSILFTVFMNFLELLVAFIQAFVFMMLSAVFIGLSQPEHHGNHNNHHDDISII